MYLLFYYLNFIYNYLIEYDMVSDSFIMAYLFNVYKQIFPYYRYFHFIIIIIIYFRSFSSNFLCKIIICIY